MYRCVVQIVDENQEQNFPSYIPVIVKRYNGCHRVDFCQGSWRNNIYYYPVSPATWTTPSPENSLPHTNVNTTTRVVSSLSIHSLCLSLILAGSSRAFTSRPSIIAINVFPDSPILAVLVRPNTNFTPTDHFVCLTTDLTKQIHTMTFSPTPTEICFVNNLSKLKCKFICVRPKRRPF